MAIWTQKSDSSPEESGFGRIAMGSASLKIKRQ
jgi:hypothetical protein